ncbi:Ltp family lipoprotein [Corynebacterium macclintockiae]|uniref:Ltp family lipoprotein n=1 Tax=Corynebacterium macclintockiae TaxID=2913501 RepID=UPI003EBD2CD1
MNSPDKAPKNKLAFLLIGAIVLIGIAVAAVWYTTNEKDHSQDGEAKPAVTSTENSDSGTGGETSEANSGAMDSTASTAPAVPAASGATSGTPGIPTDLEDPNLIPPVDESKTQQEADDAAQMALDFLSSEKMLRFQLKMQGFSEEQIKKSIEKLDPDWNQQALKAARKINEQGSPLPKDQLKYMLKVHQRFTEEQAQYAIDHL